MINSAISFGPVEEQFSVTRILSGNCSRIRLNGSVCAASMQQIVDAMEEAFAYYHFDAIEIEINTPGGDIHALNYLMEHCSNWRDHGRTIATRGVMQCCSAGALMLAFGDIGKRQVSKTTVLLFHYSRTMMSQTAVTANAASQLAVHLNTVDRRMTDTLVEHIMPEGNTAPFDGLARMQARYLWLDASLHNIGEGSDSFSQFYKKDLARLGKLFTGSPKRLREGVINHLKLRFNADQPMSLLEAYILNLIDHINGITPKTEPQLTPMPALTREPLRRPASYRSSSDQKKCPAIL